MTERHGEGERAEQARSRRFWTIIVVLMIAGGIIGGVISVQTRGDLSSPLPSGWAIAVALLYVVSIWGGTWYFYRAVDEVEINDNLWAGTAAYYFYATIYPVWYVLARGQLVPAPNQEAIFVASLVAMVIAYFARKRRA